MRGLLLACTFAVFALSISVLIMPAYAVNPGERLDDPVLEQRARNLSQGLRCLVCQNQSIDGSDAPLARDLRILVRDRLVAGDTDAEVLDFIVARYGDFVLLKPRFNDQTWALWAAPFAVLFAGGMAVLLILRRRKGASIEQAPLSLEEKQRLEDIVNNRDAS